MPLASVDWAAAWAGSMVTGAGRLARSRAAEHRRAAAGVDRREVEELGDLAAHGHRLADVARGAVGRGRARRRRCPPRWRGWRPGRRSASRRRCRPAGIEVDEVRDALLVVDADDDAGDLHDLPVARRRVARALDGVDGERGRGRRARRAARGAVGGARRPGEVGAVVVGVLQAGTGRLAGEGEVRAGRGEGQARSPRRRPVPGAPTASCVTAPASLIRKPPASVTWKL